MHHTALAGYLNVSALLALLMSSGLVGLSTYAAESADSGETAVIHLTNGSYSAGKVVDSPSGDNLVWQSPAFTSPFTFSLNSVNAVHFPVPAELPKPVGDYCFELAGGDVLFGSLLTLDGAEAVLDVSGLGQLHVERRILRRMFRWNGGDDQLFFGPSGLRGWDSIGKTAWREEAGHLIAEQKGAAIRRDFGAPARACFELELSWAKRPDFVLALGVGADPKTTLRAFRFAVWDNQLVAQRETEREADVAALQIIKPGPGRIHLLAFLDQTKGRLLVVSSGGQQLADLTVASSKPQTLGGLELTNQNGDIRFERLRISRWDGEAPRLANRDKSRIHARDGTIAYGELKSYDAAKKEFLVATDAGELRLADEQVHDVFLSEDNGDATPSLRAVYFSGLRMSGDLEKVDEKGIWIKRPGIREPLVSPVAALHTITVLRPRDQVPEITGRVGRLELDGAVLRGCLIDGKEGEASCLVWQPTSSGTASPLVRGVSARVVYRDPPPATKAQPPRTSGDFRVAREIEVRRRLGGGRATTKTPIAIRMPTSGQSILHLRSGDTLACRVTSIDEKGITLKSALTDATFVPHARIKVLELMPGATPVAIARSKKERLLTLPRMQRDHPPTQLIRSFNGDYLRGRLLAMDEKELQVELRLETKTVLRQNVARIIWLHPDEIDADAGPAFDESAGTRVQALPADGNRLTFSAEQLEGSTLSGRSELLGQCRIDIQQINQLLVGAAIEQSASGLSFHQWKLKSALDPLAAEEGEDSDSEGLASVLVGKPAPDFELELLEGGKFHLAEEKDKIIVLDFWASWCGPCLQVMPQVDEVAREFAGDNVKLVSINLQETPERIRTVLERLELKTAVALDREGIVAEKYGAVTIPQTVIIDRQGNVARLFVSASARFDEQLRTALRQVIAGPLKTD